MELVLEETGWRRRDEAPSSGTAALRVSFEARSAPRSYPTTSDIGSIFGAKAAKYPALNKRRSR